MSDAATIVLPPPAPRDDLPAIWDLVKADIAERAPFTSLEADAQLLADIDARDAFGLAKYGVRLKAHDGRSPLVDGYQEVLDSVAYLRKDVEELSGTGLDAEIAVAWAAYRSALSMARMLRASLTRRGVR